MKQFSALVPKNNKCRISKFYIRYKANTNIIRTFGKSKIQLKINGNLQ